MIFAALPEISAVQPMSGPVTGGTSVTVQGSKFVNTSSIFVSFDGLPVPATYVDQQHVVCISPTGIVPGNAMVEITLNDQQYSKQQHISFLFYGMSITASMCISFD